MSKPCQTKINRLIAMMKRQHVTPLKGALNCGIYSVSQRAGELIRAGYVIDKIWVETESGSRVRGYKILREPVRG